MHRCKEPTRLPVDTNQLPSVEESADREKEQTTRGRRYGKIYTDTSSPNYLKSLSPNAVPSQTCSQQKSITRPGLGYKVHGNIVGLVCLTVCAQFSVSRETTR